MSSSTKKDAWGTRVGIILAVTGSAVGLGNFLRFPGQAAQYGGGAFLIPYLVAFLIIGLPLAWLEWGLGRYGGARGHNSAPGIFRSLIGRPSGSYLGMLGTVMPVMIYMYYVFVEAWCLAYAWDYLTGTFTAFGGDSGAITAHFLSSTGAAADGSMFGREAGRMFVFLSICFGLNFFLIYRGIHKGIEGFCNVAMPLLFLCAVVVLVRVLTLPANPVNPEQNIINGLGYMWNPVKEGSTLWQTLSRSEVWLAATGQIFFSLSLGFGLILTYASYLKEDDDVALSSLTSVSGNGFAEVVLGGMIAIPAAFVFLGPAVVQSPPGTFGMGFITLPNVFNLMPGGAFFGFLFFFLLFLAAVTSSISMLQPAIALLEEGLGLTRKPAVAILGFITLAGCLFIVYFSKDFAALDTVDFWMANFFIFIFATAQTIVFGWVLGVNKGFEELKRGAEITLPESLKFVIKYISPSFLLIVFAVWCYQELPGRLKAIVTLPEEGPPIVLMSVGLILLVLAFFTLVVARANQKWSKEEKAS
ncbi:MAG TPA: sodium-dependent transporter [Kiritimatiellia bacterium]|nr:sodium-dependent transporter [Kiritimatiellia bacterium]HMO99823.1 sodium-dependent transporter [Kiritimatiellia bacterium]HMP97305.1 sodium-dependent transporter [Kiritimatiellia bacterium]